MFVDARSTPPRVAAVLVSDGAILYSDMAPSEEVSKFSCVCCSCFALVHYQVMATFKERDDGHIMSLELLAIAFGLSVFGERLRGMNLELYSDNTGAERATAKGGSREWDHSCIAHCIWFVNFNICCFLVCSFAVAGRRHCSCKWGSGFHESRAKTTYRTTRQGRV